MDVPGVGEVIELSEKEEVEAGEDRQDPVDEELPPKQLEDETNSLAVSVIVCLNRHEP